MRTASLLLVAALSVGLVSSDRLSVTLQPFTRVLDLSSEDGTVVVSSTGGQQSLTTFIRDVEADSDLPTVLFDSSLQNWMDQQMGVFDALHSLFAPRSPCGSRSSFAMQDPSFAYMTSSRFTPSLLATYLEQVDEQDVMADEFDQTEEDDVDEGSAWSSVFESTGAEAMEKVRQFPDWLDAEEVQGEADDEAARRTLFAPGEPGAEDQPDKEHKGHKGHKDKAHKDKDHKGHKDHKEGHMKEGHDKDHHMKEGHDKSGPHKHMASCKDLFTFGILLVGCVVVWGCLLRTAVRCSKLIRRNKQRAARRAAVVEQNPLLAPLVREDSLNVPHMAVAAHEAPTGSFYVPDGAQYIRVAYQPLSSE